MKQEHQFILFRTLQYRDPRSSVGTVKQYAILIETESAADAFTVYLNNFYAFKSDEFEIHAKEETGIWYKLEL